MDELEYIRQISLEYTEIIKRNFPNNFLRGDGSSGPDFHAHFATENSFFKGTEYFYGGELKFFHLTNYRNLFSILNSRAIRLYNLHKANDPNEYEYSARLFQATKQEIDSRKKNLYTFSFCPFSEIKNRNMWEKYGNNFGGVAIIFEIINDPTGWDNFHLSEIKYHPSLEMQNYVRDINVLKEKYSGCTFYLELEKIMALHKEEKWAGEKEVRILTYKPFQNYANKLNLLKRELKKELIIETGRIRFAEYFELNLWVKNDSARIKDRFEQTLPSPDYFIKHPQIKITNILFGENCGLSPEEYLRITPEIAGIVVDNFGYTVQLDRNLFRDES